MLFFTPWASTCLIFSLINKSSPKFHLLLKEVMPHTFSSLEPVEKRNPFPSLSPESFPIPETGVAPVRHLSIPLLWAGSPQWRILHFPVPIWL